MGNTILKWTANLLFSLAGLIIVWALKSIWYGAVYAVRHPRTSTALGLVGGAVLLLGWETVVALVGLLVITGSTWKAAHQGSWDRFVGEFLRTWLRRWWTYRRVWERVMRRCGLVVEVDDEIHYPQIRKVSTTPFWDRLAIDMQVGQEIGEWTSAGEKLRHAFNGERIAVREIKPRGVELSLMRRDPFLHVPVPAATMPACTEDIDYTALPVGLTEYLEPFTVSVVGGHLSGAGTAGSGKAGVEWNVFRALAPAIADGSVRLTFIDPKGVELRQGRALLQDQERDYASTAPAVKDLLARLVDDLEELKEERGEAGERDHVPSPETPLNLICIDELAPLLAYWPRATRDKIEDSLGILLTQGRALGYIVIGLVQEPTKDIFRVRDLFQRRLGLRLPTEDHTDAALTDKAVDRGAGCHNIPESLPGVCFALADGEKAAIRARLGYVRDQDIADLIAHVQRLREAARFEARRTAAGEEKEAA
ncbi:hypothetical protein [Kutzneria buriramensis]|uniref:S-DNA-T family DNA segregation ATPase FtsK/SpoIIIE n=1 Tax=Kutzneria buriramensis TaxID=1045776 RepID=A0A3E0G6L1_9PSEU|nr:hypothetical protein [Kutzneria buriramensis]REH17437.1 S-DNA-T family DNA segregation ATPase FtsK/SpoIIIE [Kutzneria buriramensis]